MKDLHPWLEPYSPESESTSEESVRLIQVGSSSPELSDDNSSEDTLSTYKLALPYDFHFTSCQEPGTSVCRDHRDDQAIAALHRNTPKSSDDDESSANKPVLPSNPLPIISYRNHRNDKADPVPCWY